jgi:prepilin-type processing-associated H-X9-DG protein
VPFEKWPEDLVVLFEVVPPTEGARNISGGPEILNIANHDYFGMNVLLGNGKSIYVNARDIPSLNWSTNPDFVFPYETASYIETHCKEEYEPTTVSGSLKIILISATSICGFLAVLLKRYTTAYIFISAALGVLWGIYSTSIYVSRPAAYFWFSLPLWPAGCFCLHIILKRLKLKYPHAVSKDLAILTGICVGMIFVLLWSVSEIFSQGDYAMRHFIGNMPFAMLAFNSLCGLLLGAAQGFAWKKAFGIKKLDASDAWTSQKEMAMPDDELKNPKLKLCPAAAASLAVLVLTFLSFTTPLNNFVLTVAGFCLSFILSILSLFIFALSPIDMRGRFISCTSLVISMLMLLFIGAVAQTHFPSHLRCGTQLKGLGTAIIVYQDDTRKLPDVNRWEDELIETVDTERSQYVCPVSKFEGSSYAINKYVYDIPEDMPQPGNMVLLYEAIPPYEGAANISGGPEILNISNHGNAGMNVLFLDGHVEFVKTGEISKLKWSINPDFVFPTQSADYLAECVVHKEKAADNSKITIIAMLSFAAICAAAFFVIKSPLIVYSLASISIAILWNLLYSSIFRLDPLNNFYYNLPIWFAAAVLIHLLLRRLQPEYQQAFEKSLPELVGAVIIIISLFFWMLLAGFTHQKTEAYFRIVGNPAFVTLTQNCFWGFWLGGLQGFAWKKAFDLKS